MLGGFLVAGKEHDEQSRVQDARVAAELLHVQLRIGKQLGRVPTVGSVRRVLADDLDLQPEGIVEGHRVRRVEERRFAPRRVQRLPVRRQHEVASLAGGFATGSGRLRIDLLRVDAVTGRLQPCGQYRVEAQLVEGVEPARGLFFIQPGGLGGQRRVESVGKIGNRKGAQSAYSTSSPLITSVIFGAACAWNSPALSLPMYRW